MKAEELKLIGKYAEKITAAGGSLLALTGDEMKELRDLLEKRMAEDEEDLIIAG